jgi:hypothetical protein
VQKCFSPAPVRTTTRTPRVADSSRKVSARWSRICAVSELPASGRSITTRAMPPSMEVRMRSVTGTSAMGAT